MGQTKKTTDVFGEYIDQYSMNQAIYDGSTVPIHYEKRRAEVHIEDSDLKEIDKFYLELKNIDNSDSDYIEKAKINYLKKELLKVKMIFGDLNVIKRVVTDFWHHYDLRKNVLNGKALFVAFDRNIAFNIYKEMILQRPEYKDKIIIVMTSSNKDSKEMMEIIPNDKQKEELAVEFRSDNSKYKIAIVVDMWLTGFDVPDLDTLYLYKVIKWHNLMQTLARVNRTYSKFNKENPEKNKIKEDGLVVDYIGIWHHISDALKQFAGININKLNYDVEEVAKSLKKLCSETYKMFLEDLGLFEKWNSSNQNLSFESLTEGMEVILDLEKKKKDLFFKNVSKINRFYKLSISILDDSTKKMAQYLILLKNLIRNQSVDEAIDLKEMLEQLKNKLSGAIKVGDIEVSTILLNGRKDLAYVSELLQKELYAFKKDKKVSALKIKELENTMKAEINEFSKTNPLKGFELSNELKKLIKKYESDKDFEEFISQLMKFSKEMIDGYKNNEFIGDEPLQAFYSILADERFKTRNYNSEVLKEITLKIKNIVDKNITNQWWTNKKIQSTISDRISIRFNEIFPNDIDGSLKFSYNFVNAKDDSVLFIGVYEIKEFKKINLDDIDANMKIIKKDKSLFNSYLKAINREIKKESLMTMNDGDIKEIKNFCFLGTVQSSNVNLLYDGNDQNVESKRSKFDWLNKSFELNFNNIVLNEEKIDFNTNFFFDGNGSGNGYIVKYLSINANINKKGRIEKSMNIWTYSFPMNISFGILESKTFGVDSVKEVVLNLNCTMSMDSNDINSFSK